MLILQFLKDRQKERVISGFLGVLPFKREAKQAEMAIQEQR